MIRATLEYRGKNCDYVTFGAWISNSSSLWLCHQGLSDIFAVDRHKPLDVVLSTCKPRDDDYVTLALPWSRPRYYKVARHEPSRPTLPYSFESWVRDVGKGRPVYVWFEQ